MRGFYRKKDMKKLIKSAAALCTLFSIAVFGAVIYSEKNLPDSFQVTQGQTLRIVREIPISASASEKVMQAAATSVGSKYNVSLNLFGIIPLKKANVEVVDKSFVIPAGTPFGIKIFTDGVLVVGLTDVDTKDGLINPAKKAGIKEGDVLVSVNGTSVNTNEDVATAIEKANGKSLKMVIRRKNMSFTVNFVPLKSQTDDKYKAGMWVRDSSAGIGTLTFYSPQSGIFAGLGHAICDVDTGEILPLMTGDIVSAEILGATKGKSGVPGELRGRFLEEKGLGTLVQNGETGVYGKLNEIVAKEEMVEIAMKQQVKTGKAQVLTTIKGTKPKYYDCVIEKVNWNDDSPTQNMVIEITDKALLESTGGIVQGMSGSPILQNGKLIGAVTHVFVNEPKKGYAIFAENMQSSAQKAENQIFSKAS